MVRESVPPELAIDSKMDPPAEPEMVVEEEETPLDLGDKKEPLPRDSPLQSPRDEEEGPPNLDP